MRTHNNINGININGTSSNGSVLSIVAGRGMCDALHHDTGKPLAKAIPTGTMCYPTSVSEVSVSRSKRERQRWQQSEQANRTGSFLEPPAAAWASLVINQAITL